MRRSCAARRAPPAAPLRERGTAPNRPHLRDEDDAVGVVGVHQIARVHLPEAEAAVDGRDDPRIGQLKLRAVDLCLVGLERAAILLDQRFLRRHLLPGDQALGRQLRVAHQVALGILQPGFVFLHLALGLRQRHFVRSRVDLGQELACGDALAFGELHAIQSAVEPRADGHGVEWCHRTERANLHIDGVAADRHGVDRRPPVRVARAEERVALRRRRGRPAPYQTAAAPSARMYDSENPVAKTRTGRRGGRSGGGRRQIRAAHR